MEEKKEENTNDDVAKLKDQLMRLAAEFDNYKKQVQKDFNNAKQLGTIETISKLLNILDELELALTTLEKNSENAKGVGLVLSNFIEVLKGMGLREVPTNGKYDPYKHEVILAIESDKDDGTIIDVVRKGYMLNDILIRPASVVVSKKR